MFLKLAACATVQVVTTRVLPSHAVLEAHNDLEKSDIFKNSTHALEQNGKPG
jgi:hypothetical protein